MTFTNQAAAEMRQRLEQRLGGRRAVQRMTIGTFHAICLELLGKVRLLGPGEALTVAVQVLEQCGRKGSPKGLLQAVSQVKNGLGLERTGLDEELYNAYCARLRELEVLDFDDLLSQALELDTVGNRRFTHLLVDEFQDLNDVQYQLVRAWSRGGKSLFVIGDPDQSIYGFRGATGRCFQRLGEDQPECREIRVKENYRSTPEILRAALPVIEKNPGEVRVLRPNCPSGLPVRLVRAGDSFAEGIFIAKEISRMTGGVDMLEAQKLGHRQQARAFSDIAVLCRTHRQLELVEKCLRHDDIPCIVSGREDFLDADQVRGPLAFLHTLQHPQDLAALETGLKLLWNCPADLVQTAQRACQGQKTLGLPALREEFRGYGPLEGWLDRAEEWLPLVEGEKPWKLVERWQERYGSNAALERLKNMAVFHAGLDQLWNALTLGQEADLCRAAGKGWQSGAVRLMTLHASKGLEFPAVFLAGLTAGTLPMESQSRPGDVQEERRLFYVGMTRAREELILTTSPEPSAFLEDLPAGVERESAAGRRERPMEQFSLF